MNATSYTVNADNVITAVSPAGTAGTAVDITVTTPRGTSPTSLLDTFKFVAPATQLVVTTPPASVTANAPFGLTVNAEDGSGNTDTTYNGPVTLALSGGTSGAMLGGTLTVNAVNGKATFTNPTINMVGTGYTLSASSGTLTAATIPGINVAAATGPATQLVVTTPPASVTVNAAFGLTVNAEDDSGNTDTTYNGPVTLALSGGTSGAMLGGTVTGTAANGVATFTNLTINMVGTGYTLSASSGTLTAATIPGITVAAATGPATQLVATTPPASVTVNATFGLTVNAEDGSGNTDTTYNGPVTLALSGGTSGARARRHFDRQRRQRQGHLHQPDHQHGRHGLHPLRLQRHPDGGDRSLASTSPRLPAPPPSSWSRRTPPASP